MTDMRQLFIQCPKKINAVINLNSLPTQFPHSWAAELSAINTGTSGPIVASLSSVPVALEHMTIGACRVDGLIPADLALASNTGAVRRSALLQEIPMLALI